MCIWLAGAMEKTTCPECVEKVEIGGSNHKLAEGNQPAPEMDGSRESDYQWIHEPF